MNKALSVLFVSMIAYAPMAAQHAAAAGAAVAKEGDMMIDATGGRLGVVDRVDDDGSAEIIIDGRVVTIPASTLTVVNGHLTTSLKKPQVLAAQ